MMVISGTLAVAGALVASFSGALIAGSNLFSGWRQRKFMEKESSIGRTHAEKLQKLQMQFQLALQDRNFIESERLQREMAEVQYENARALQKENFINQEAAWEEKKFYENAWPFRTTPKRYVSQLTKTYRLERVPLQILIPNSLTEGLHGLGDWIKQYYPLQSETPVYYYDGGWKDGHTINGAALLSSLYEVFKGLPTLVLLPQGSLKDRFSLEIGYWGLGQMEDGVPKRVSIVSSLDMYELEQRLLREQADNLIADYGSDMSHDDENMGTRRRELARRRELEANGSDYEQIDRKLKNEAKIKFVYKRGDRDVDESKKEVVKQICDVVCVAYADVYHLLETGVMPQAPLLAAKNNPLFADKGVRNMLCALYKGLLNECKKSDETRLLCYPLYCALIVDSLHKAGWIDESHIFEKEALDSLLELYPSKSVDNVAPSHLDAISILMKNGVESLSWSLPMRASSDSCRNCDDNHTKELGITMIGGSRTGKTCYLCAMAHKMAIAQNGFTFSPNMLDKSESAKNARGLNIEWRKMQHVYDGSHNIIQRGHWISGTAGSKDFDFLCSYAGRPLASFTWHDYRGGIVHGNVQTSSDEELEILFDRISNSSCLIVCIAADRLQDLIRGSDEAAREFGVYASYLLSYRQKCGRTVPVVFAITKADKLASGEFAAGVKILREEIFSAFFNVGNSEDWFMMFVGVSLGEFDDSDDGLVYGEFAPVNIHLPVLFAVRCAMLQKELERHNSLEAVQSDADRQADKLNRENKRTAIGKLFHRKDRDSIRYQLQGLDSKRADIERDIDRLGADIAAITKELIGADPDDIQLYNGGRRFTIENR